MQYLIVKPRPAKELTTVMQRAAAFCCDKNYADHGKAIKGIARPRSRPPVSLALYARAAASVLYTPSFDKVVFRRLE
jgi:hypothetical protein